VIGSCLEKIRDDRDRRTWRLGLGLWVRIGWLRRAGIDRRLRQHIVVEPDCLIVATLGESVSALLRDLIPIGARLRLVGVARAGVGR
jgi:hypothetical protein